MNFPLFISRRLQYNQDNAFSATVIRIAAWSMALGTAILIITFAVLQGFRDNIRAKLFSLEAHVTVSKYNIGSKNDENPFSKQIPLYLTPTRFEGVTGVQAFIFKPALLKTKTEVQGVIIKGLGPDFNLNRFKTNLVSGRFIRFGKEPVDEVVISQKQANLLNLKLGDEVLLYFMQNPPRARKLKIVGIFETGLEDFDDNLLLADIKVLQDLNGWDRNTVAGLQVFINNFDDIDYLWANISENLGFELRAQKITDTHFQLFEWLNMIGRNAEILLVLITLVSCFNMISTLLIMMLERSSMIGMLKTLGATNSQIRSIFILNGLQICIRGLFFGNAFGLIFCALQYQFRFIPLDPENYYMNYVPIGWNWIAFLLVNLLTIVLTFLALLIPTVVIANVKPVKAIKFA